MKEFLFPIIAIIILLPTNIVLALPSTGTQVFFDDFTQSQLSSTWTPRTSSTIDLGNIVQEGGYLTLVNERSLWAGNACSGCFGDTELLANGTNPIVNSNIPSRQFFQVAWKMQPFNFTFQTSSATTGTSQFAAELDFGLFSQTYQGFGVQMFAFSNSSSISAVNGNRFSVNMMFLHPMSGVNPSNCFVNQLVYAWAFNHCSGGVASPGIRYSGPEIDLDSVHVFVLQMILDQVSHTSWVAFHIDNNAWMNMTQAACQCIDTIAAGGGYSNLYPQIEFGYCPGVLNIGYLATCNGAKPIQQSVAANFDYVLITDYAPSMLPQGQLLSSNINPPLQSLGIYKPGGFSLTQYVQFQANEIGQGNIYAGGLFLTGIFILIITLGLAGVMWKTKMGFSVFGMIWNISTLAFIYLMYYTGVIPLLIPVLVTIGAAAIMFGIFRSGPPSMGGEVQS